MPFVEVAVNSGMPHRQAFSYATPDGVALQPGDAVFVPFGRRFLQGIVLEAPEVPSFHDPKLIDARIGDRPVISPQRAKLAQWISDYYLAPLFPSVALMLPPGFERKPLTYYQSFVSADDLPNHKVPPRQRTVLEHLIAAGRSEQKDIERDIDAKNIATALSQLVERGLIERSYGHGRPSVRAKSARYVLLAAPAATAEAAAAEYTTSRNSRLSKTLRLLLDEGPMLQAS